MVNGLQHQINAFSYEMEHAQVFTLMTNRHAMQKSATTLPQLNVPSEKIPCVTPIQTSLVGLKTGSFSILKQNNNNELQHTYSGQSFTGQTLNFYLSRCSFPSISIAILIIHLDNSLWLGSLISTISKLFCNQRVTSSSLSKW